LEFPSCSSSWQKLEIEWLTFSDGLTGQKNQSFFLLPVSFSICFVQ
jgi:hypothetical protein